MRDIKFRGKTAVNFPDNKGNVVIPKDKWIYGDFVHQDTFNRAMIKQGNYTACVDENTVRTIYRT